MFIAKDLIAKKRDNIELSESEIKSYVNAVVDGSIADEQISAFCMATYFTDMTTNETYYLTKAMVESGYAFNWQELGFDKVPVDKHSSGGVGDKVSFMYSPLVSSCGGFNPMLSGRSLGHTGGTLDKFEAIANLNTSFSEEQFIDLMKKNDVAIISTTPNIAPADKKIYAIRDITSTVPSYPLIIASILSKKKAAGIDCLVMDIKCGNGAFMQNIDEARILARRIVDVGSRLNMKVHAIITDMNEVLGYSAGNALELAETARWFLNEQRDKHLTDVCIATSARSLVLGNYFSSMNDATNAIMESLENGSAIQKFNDMIAFQGGPENFVENYERILPKAKICEPIYASESGYVSSIDVTKLGIAVQFLGGGRLKQSDIIDYAVGLDDIVSVGDFVDSNKPLCYVHANDEQKLKQIQANIQTSFNVSNAKVDKLESAILDELY